MRREHNGAKDIERGTHEGFHDCHTTSKRLESAGIPPSSINFIIINNMIPIIARNYR